jgi:hypothetical protein
MRLLCPALLYMLQQQTPLLLLPACTLSASALALVSLYLTISSALACDRVLPSCICFFLRFLCLEAVLLAASSLATLALSNVCEWSFKVNPFLTCRIILMIELGKELL